MEAANLLVSLSNTSRSGTPTGGGPVFSPASSPMQQGRGSMCCPLYNVDLQSLPTIRDVSYDTVP